MAHSKQDRKKGGTPPPTLSFSSSAVTRTPPSALAGAFAPSLSDVIRVRPSASSFYPPNGTSIIELDPIPPQFSHPHVLGAQDWHGYGLRIAADAQLIIDYKRESEEYKREKEENERLRLQLRHFTDVSERLTKTEKELDELRRENAELREELKKIQEDNRENAELREELKKIQEDKDDNKQRFEQLDDNKQRFEQLDREREEKERKHKRKCITAELVTALENAICVKVFGRDYRKHRIMPITDIMYVDAGRHHEPWKDEWRRLRDELQITQKFGSTFDFCDFLKEMKRERNEVSHQTFRVRLDIEQLQEEVLAYCEDYEAEQVARMNFVVEPGQMESEKQKAKQEREVFQQKSKSMMEMLQSLTGDYPFGKQA